MSRASGGGAINETRQETWAWVQLADYEALVERLAIARDLSVPERERENLCACAHTALKALLVERGGAMDSELQQQIAFLNDNQHAQIALLQEILEAVRSSLWTCPCGHVNGPNVSACSQCGRKLGER